MTKQEAVAKIFITAFNSLPKNEKKIILEELAPEYNEEFSHEEWEKLYRLANQRGGKTFNSGKDAIRFLKTLQ
jgi:hypothetical protein